MNKTSIPIRSLSRWYSSTCLASASHTIKLFFRDRWNEANSTRNASRASSTEVFDVLTDMSDGKDVDVELARRGKDADEGMTFLYATEA